MSPILENFSCLLPKNINYHVYASYSNKNYEDLVQPILMAMESLGVKVYDPDRDALIGEMVLKNIVDRGISVCKTTILFLTKNFVSSKWCHYEANIALKRYIMTRGKYRVIPVLLQPCAVPKYMKIVGCVHAWKYQGRQVLKRIMKSLTAPSLKFRRIRLIGVTAFHKNTSIVKKLRLDINGKQETGPPLNLQSLVKLPGIMRHCVIQCRYGQCQFMCAGRNYIQMYYHVRHCQYLPVKCCNRKCFHCCPRRDMDKHLINCKYKDISCPFAGCKAKFPDDKLELHKNECVFQSVVCGNMPSGCPQRLLKKNSKEHLKFCEFGSVTCKDCRAVLVKKYQHEHICDNAFMICPRCGARELQSMYHTHDERCSTQKIKCRFHACIEVLPRRNMKEHEQYCQFRTAKCRIIGCDFEGYEIEIDFHMTICGFRQWKCTRCDKELLYKKKKSHSLNCDPLVVCPDCGAMLTSSSKLTHERFICPKRQIVSMCEICETAVPFNKSNIHAEEHRLNGESLFRGQHSLPNLSHSNTCSTQKTTLRSATFDLGSLKSSDHAEEKTRKSSDPGYSLESLIFVLGDKNRETVMPSKKECIDQGIQGKTDINLRRKNLSSVFKFRELLRTTEKCMTELKAFQKGNKH